MNTRIQFQDMPFVNIEVGREDLEILFLGYLYDSMLNAKYFVNCVPPDQSDVVLYQAHLTILKSYLTDDEYLSMLQHILKLKV